MAMEQRDGFDYEVDIVFTLDQRTHYAVATKNRTSLWTDGSPFIVTPEEGRKLREWLDTETPDPICCYSPTTYCTGRHASMTQRNSKHSI
jgi:hypothetical protein